MPSPRACLLLALLPASAARLAAQTSAPRVEIARVMADPAGVPDERGEWIELRASGAAVDLRGWRLASGRDPGHVITADVRLPAGGRVTLARDGDARENGGVHADYVYTGITLANAGDWLALRDPHGTTIDSVAWSPAPRGEPFLPSAHLSAAPPGRERARAAGAERAGASAPAESAGRRQPPSRELTVRLLDVGQGDAIEIENGGSRIIVDGGPDTAAFGRWLDRLHLDGDTIDAVILTHQHADHYQGLRDLFDSARRITVRYVWENEDPSPNRTLAILRDSIASRVRQGSLIYRDTDDPCADGRPICTLTLRGGAVLHILRPDPRGGDPNDRSVALKLVGPDSASFTMWLAGDAEHSAIDWMIAHYARSPGMDVDVLKADHHGSCNGISPAYLDALTPKQVVVSVGAVNDYGHMHAQTEALLRARGIPWYRTDQNGLITIRTPGTPGGGYTISVERGTADLRGPSDRRSTQADCRTP